MTRLVGGDTRKIKEKMAQPFSLLFFPLSLMALSFRSRATRGKESVGLSRMAFRCRRHAERSEASVEFSREDVFYAYNV